MKGNIPSEETRKKIGQAQLAENNHHWFGNKTKYQGVHKWVRSRLKKPELCQRCAINPPKQMHNISGKYRRDLDDWLYVCVKCHAEIDGRVRRLKQRRMGCSGKRLHQEKLKLPMDYKLAH